MIVENTPIAYGDDMAIEDDDDDDDTAEAISITTVTKSMSIH
jgi:hypothetical protein